MKKMFLSVLTLVLIAQAVFAQTPPSWVQTQGNQRTPPQIRTRRTNPELDEEWKVDDEIIVYSTKDRLIPLNPDTPIQLKVGLPFSTQGLKNEPTPRMLQVSIDVQSAYGDIVVPKTTGIMTLFRGNAAGIVKGSALYVEPQTYELNVTRTNYVQVGWDGEHRVYLKPGLWRFTLHCKPQSIVTQEQVLWNAGRDEETHKITGVRRANQSHNSPTFQESVDSLGILPSPTGVLLYTAMKIGTAFGFILKRHNAVLPASSEMIFRIDAIEASYVEKPKPKGEAVPMR